MLCFFLMVHVDLPFSTCLFLRVNILVDRRRCRRPFYRPLHHARITFYQGTTIFKSFWNNHPIVEFFRLVPDEIWPFYEIAIKRT